uniref:Uncharacterized protein n=1 Tax=Vespula pensylvanica TaxID=30213 RepID=A0A834NAI9_VESPE|nr:hypothetical protein H0235_015533 [Vespula pensylvanica]
MTLNVMTFLLVKTGCRVVVTSDCADVTLMSRSQNRFDFLVTLACILCHENKSHDSYCCVKRKSFDVDDDGDDDGVDRRREPIEGASSAWKEITLAVYYQRQSVVSSLPLPVACHPSISGERTGTRAPLGDDGDGDYDDSSSSSSSLSSNSNSNSLFLLPAKFQTGGVKAPLCLPVADSPMLHLSFVYVLKKQNEA